MPLNKKEHGSATGTDSKFNVVYSMPAAGNLNAQLACRQSVMIGWKLERHSNSVIVSG